MKPAPTLDDVAAAAGVSRSTASRAINGGARVSPDALAAVQAAVAELGYTPNPAARSLVTRRTDSIALVVPVPDTTILADPFLVGVLRGVSVGLKGSDLQLVLLLRRDDESPDRIARYLASGHVDGAIIASHRRGDGIEAALESSGLPAVIVGRPYGGYEFPHVELDNAGAARLATEHLISKGRTRIAAITGPLNMAVGVDRKAGWQSALESAGLAADAWAEAKMFTAGAGAEAAEQLLTNHPEIDAIFAASDLIAEGAMSVLAAAGKRVPDDIAIVGIDNLGVAERTNPPLTSVINPVEQISVTATEILLGLMRGEEAPPPRYLPARLVFRASA